MIRAAASERERAIARALELGINHFDTAAAYGDGESEVNLGAVFKALRPTATVATKFSLRGRSIGTVDREIERSLEASLARLRMPSVDLYQLHNPIGARGGEGLTPDFVVTYVAPALQRLRDRGKVRWIGFTGIGETAAIKHVLDAGAFDTVQVVYNPLNATAAFAPRPDFAGQDYGRIASRAAESGVGTFGIRILAGGAITGASGRHAVASPTLDPIGSGATLDDDIAHARRLRHVLAKHADGPVEAAIRFAGYGSPVDTAIIGCSSIEQLEQAVRAVNRGPLPAAAIREIVGLAAP